MFTLFITLAHQAELLKDRDAASVGVNLNNIRRQGVEVIVADFYVLWIDYHVLTLIFGEDRELCD